MTELQSHPDRTLALHIEQIQLAIRTILQRHGTSYPILGYWAEEAARFHDGGKATPMFQEFIKDPLNYHGDKDLKQHTILSTIITLLHSADQQWDPLMTLAVALSVRGHHGRLPTLPDPTSQTPSGAYDLSQFSKADRFLSILAEQIPVLSGESLASALDIRWAREPSDVFRTIRDAKRRLTSVWKQWRKLAQSDEAQIIFRLQVQFVFSLLLEADKAFLAIHDPERYIDSPFHPWDPLWVDSLIAHRPQRNDAMAVIRNQVRETVTKTLQNSASSDRLFSLTAPTGVGKTLLAASWSLALRKEAQDAGHPPPQIIIIQPYLSITDQTVDVWRKLLSDSLSSEVSWLLPVHSLAPRTYDQSLEPQEESFFIDTWRSDVIVTTYDQFLMTLFDDRARHQMRFHHLWDALIVIDEVQALPPKLWAPLQQAIETLSSLSRTRVLLMSATLPNVFSQTTPLLAEPESVYSKLGRYQLVVRREPCALEEFISHVVAELPNWLAAQQRVLITLNTRASARAVRSALSLAWPDDVSERLYFITTDVTPRDRKRQIKEIQKAAVLHTPCVVVSTQTVEAGVDLDMSHVIRDFAPWDSLVQIAGRCNRENQRDRETVEIWNLYPSSSSRPYSGMIYDPLYLQETQHLLNENSIILEEDTLVYSQRYFHRLAQVMDTGSEYAQKYRQFQPREDIRVVLRGDPREDYEFLVLEEDPELERCILETQQIPDRWLRRESWRRLSPRIAEVSIRVTARSGFAPESLGRSLTDDLWVLDPSRYHPDRGLLIDEATIIL